MWLQSLVFANECAPQVGEQFGASIDTADLDGDG